MATALFNSTGTFGKVGQLGKWTSALFQTGVVTRIFNAKPIWAQLKITERCNLSCGYCTEHNNCGKHVPLEIVLRWVDHCRKLGVKHIEFIGGEPLMHPQIFEMLEYVKSLRINTGMTTNGFLMDSTVAERLVDSGVTRLQLSMDCIEENSVTKKAFNLLKPQLEIIKNLDIWVHVNSVIVKETVYQAYKLAELLFGLGIPVAFSPAHDRGVLKIDSTNNSIISFLDWLEIKKDFGAPVNMPNFLINYYRELLSGREVSWSCEGGCKAFYVDTEGNFQVCSHKPSEVKFEDVDQAVLRSNHCHKKGCEKKCGVSCMIINSMPFSRLDYVAKGELFNSNKTAVCEIEAREQIA